MEGDYIRRKPLITVTVEVEVGGEGVPGPRVPELGLSGYKFMCEPVCAATCIREFVR